MSPSSGFHVLPSIPVTLPPASSRISAAARVSHGCRLASQKPSMRPAATQHMSMAADPRRRTGRAELLGQHVVIGKALGDQRAKHAFDFEVDLGDEIDRALLVDAQRALA